MAESGAEGEFRVSDRRRRAEQDEPAPPPRPASDVEDGDRPAAEAARSADERAGARSAGEPARSLEGLFVMLASSAMVALGEAGDSGGEPSRPDPVAASGAIDLLVLLREKTEGNRTPRETHLLGQLIYDLQLRYVAATRPRL